MKVSKRQLRVIIREEKSKLLKESMKDDYAAMGNFEPASAADQSKALGALHDAIDAVISVMGPDEALIELQGIIDEMDQNRSLSPDGWRS